MRGREREGNLEKREREREREGERNKLTNAKVYKIKVLESIIDPQH